MPIPFNTASCSTSTNLLGFFPNDSWITRHSEIGRTRVLWAREVRLWEVDRSTRIALPESWRLRKGNIERIAGDNSPSVQQPVLGLKSYDLTPASGCSSTFAESAKSAVCRLRVSVLKETVGRTRRAYSEIIFSDWPPSSPGVLSEPQKRHLPSVQTPEFAARQA